MPQRKVGSYNSDEVEFSDYIENENNSNSNDENDTGVVIEGENG